MPDFGSTEPFSELAACDPRWGIHIESNQKNARGTARAFREATQKLFTSFSGLVIFALVAFLPGVALAFTLSLWPGVSPSSQLALSSVPSSETPALKAAVNVDPDPGKGATDIAISGGVALLPQTGPKGTIADIADAPASTQISIYIVRNGDSLPKIAKLFGVSANTILWANNLKSASGIHPGDELVILPVSGVEHVVLKGETLASIVKKYKGNMQDVLDYNNLSPDTAVAVGDSIIIPDGVDYSLTPNAPAPHGGSATPSGNVAVGCVSSFERLIPGSGGPEIPGYFMRPIAGGVKSQCLHGYNAVDLRTPTGTSVDAAAAGEVIVSRDSGYNGGYGKYIVIEHPNGTQTVYAHLSETYVTSGSQVEQGQLIALSGNTGRSTGAHLHFEVRGAANPF